MVVGCQRFVYVPCGSSITITSDLTMGPSSPSQCRSTFILVHSSHLALSASSSRTSAI